MALTQRRRARAKLRPSSWTVETEVLLHGRQVAPGTELSFRDHDGGRCRGRFVEHVSAPSGVWVTVRELDRTGAPMAWRSFSLERLLTVHRKTTTRSTKASRS